MSVTRPPARPRDERIRDTLHRLEHDVDAWFATADPAGSPYLMPLSFLWDGHTVLISTAGTNPTARFLEATGTSRIAFGHTRDVILVDAELRETIPAAEIPDEVGDAFAARTGFDPRDQSGGYLYFRLAPRKVQAWREANELSGRTLMTGGTWLTGEEPHSIRPTRSERS
ncbi:pyridoxamine 5'-phosphate oxidase family protein [Nonomuraea phyllanthi]|uniref:pyridoxamine 5'-phosphate oxidase family protein n=1 Tax=Nonomuraea phyllanthi TaxID=2219224 RepID=UPI001D01A552|nr:pyridoxamine 5'-phosphate oxidase family protein [Nonomuraea phyllanthi]